MYLHVDWQITICMIAFKLLLPPPPATNKTRFTTSHFLVKSNKGGKDRKDERCLLTPKIHFFSFLSFFLISSLRHVFNIIHFFTSLSSLTHSPTRG